MLPSVAFASAKRVSYCAKPLARGLATASTANPTANLAAPIPPVRLYSPNGQLATKFYTNVITKALETSPALIQQASDDLAAFAVYTKDSSVQGFVSDPTVSLESLKEFVSLVSTRGGYQPTTVQLLEELAASRKLREAADVSENYARLVNTLLRRYTINVTVQTEEEIPSKEELRKHFELPSDATITLNSTVDESLMGGYIAATEDRLIDLSLRNQVQALQTALIAAGRRKLDAEKKAMEADLAN